MKRSVTSELKALADADVALKNQRFFKTGADGYAVKDRFLGLTVPVVRMHVKQFYPLTLSANDKLLSSSFHELRLFGVLMLVELYQRGDASQRQSVFLHYLKNTRYINSWDLVDASAYKILGPHLIDSDRSILHRLVQSPDLWERRIAMLATFHFIRSEQFDDTLSFADKLIDDEQDLIHKASGWMLREVGKRNLPVLKSWLAPRYKRMPRTMLRYAIEKLPKHERDRYLKGQV